MLTDKEKQRIVNTNYIAPHLFAFCHRWHNDPECPPHFIDMMRRFLGMSHAEQKKFYIIDDELYTMDQYAMKTNYRLINPTNNKYRENQHWQSTKVKHT
tara:strand:- start:1899 stop:2195 length:297 start_codon:yes stop_codon:yes gene_type:complete